MEKTTAMANQTRLHSSRLCQGICLPTVVNNDLVPLYPAFGFSTVEPTQRTHTVPREHTKETTTYESPRIYILSLFKFTRIRFSLLQTTERESTQLHASCGIHRRDERIDFRYKLHRGFGSLNVKKICRSII